MSDLATEPCRSCGAQVIWCETAGGRAMPVDAVPVPGGNIAIGTRPLQRGPGRPLVSTVAKELAFGRRDLRKSHFATCAQASKWRRKRSTP